MTTDRKELDKYNKNLDATIRDVTGIGEAADQGRDMVHLATAEALAPDREAARQAGEGLSNAYDSFVPEMRNPTRRLVREARHRDGDHRDHTTAQRLLDGAHSAGLHENPAIGLHTAQLQAGRLEKALSDKAQAIS